MKHAYVFPGQGAQAVGMGKDLYDNVPEAKALFEQANEILGFRITDIMFAGTPDELKQTKVTQPAVFLHSVILAKALGVGARHGSRPLAGRILGPGRSRSPLVRGRPAPGIEARPGHAGRLRGAAGYDGRHSGPCRRSGRSRLVLETDGVVVAANYNCPGQLVISGAVEAVDAACEKLKAAGARRALRLPVGGAFHSPLMEPARAELAEAIAEAPIHTPVCPIYQNVDAKPRTDPAVIRENLIAQLTAPVRWTQIVRNMLADGATEFTELGPGNVLQGLIKKVDAEAAAESRSTL